MNAQLSYYLERFHYEILYTGMFYFAIFLPQYVKTL